MGNTVAEFSRWLPTTGSWVTYIGKGLGPVWGTAFAVTFLLALAPGAASLLAIQGGWASTMIKQYAHVHIPWQVLCVVLAVVLLVVVLRGVRISTKVAGVMFVFEMVILVGVSVAILIVHRDNLSLAPFEPSHLAGGLKGLGLAFPLATYMFIGWRTLPPGRRDPSPRRNVPRAIMMSIAVMVAAFVLFSDRPWSASTTTPPRWPAQRCPSWMRLVGSWAGHLLRLSGRYDVHPRLVWSRL